MSSKKNYYEILGIDKNATTEDIKKAFKKLFLVCCFHYKDLLY